jgi:hypothetical protein
LLHDFCHRVCEAQLTQMDAKLCSFFLYHANVVNTTVCCANQAKYCLGDFSTLAPTSPSFSISFFKSFTRLKTVSLRRTGASEKFRLNLRKYFLITILFSVSHRKLQTAWYVSQWPRNVSDKQRGNTAVRGFGAWHTWQDGKWLAIDEI